MDELLSFYRGGDSTIKNYPIKDGQFLIGLSSNSISSMYMDDLNKDGEPVRHQVDFSNFLNRTGDTMTGVLTLSQGHIVHTAGGIGGQQGYVKIATITALYAESPIPLEMKIASRNVPEPFTLSMGIREGTDEVVIREFRVQGEYYGTGAYLVPTSNKTADLYLHKYSNNGYDMFNVYDYVNPQRWGVSITWKNEQVSTLPNGAIQPVRGGYVSMSNKATRLAEPRSIDLAGDVTGSVDFDGSQNAEISVKRKGCMVGRSGTVKDNPNSWFKFASTSIDKSSTDKVITFLVSMNLCGTKRYGILKAHIRSGAAGKIDSPTTSNLSWIICQTGINPAEFVYAYKEGTTLDIELWVKAAGDYFVYQFEVLSEGERRWRDKTWTLYDNYGVGEASPTEGYTQVESVIDSIKNPVDSIVDAEHGGTGEKTLLNSANALFNALSIGGSVPSDSDYYISQGIGGAQNYCRRPISLLYEYIKGKLDTSSLKLGKGYYIHLARGVDGTAGYSKIATLKATVTYINRPLMLEVTRRGTKESTRLYIQLSNANHLDPDLLRFTYIGTDVNAYIYKSATSTWDLYVQKSEAYDTIIVIDYHLGPGAVPTLEWTDIGVSSVPTGAVKATLGGNVAHADTAENVVNPLEGSMQNPKAVEYGTSLDNLKDPGWYTLESVSITVGTKVTIYDCTLQVVPIGLGNTIKQYIHTADRIYARKCVGTTFGEWEIL